MEGLMECINELVDDQYPFTEITHTRDVARAILVDGDKKGWKVCLMHLKCEDKLFGDRDYYETPGGGVEKGESLAHAVIREVEEETGYQASIVCPIGYVSDYYNLIKRHNMNYYFLLKVEGKGSTHLEDYEKSMISEMKWFSLSEAIEAYETHNSAPLEKLVCARELPVLKKAMEILRT